MTMNTPSAHTSADRMSPALPATLPGVAGIDCTDPVEMHAWALLLFRHLERHGGLNAPACDTPAVRAMRAEASRWLVKAEPLLLGGPVAHVPGLLHAYGLLHRVCRHSRPALLDRRVREETLRRWLGGERTLTSAQVVALLWPLVESDPRNAEPRYSLFCSRSLGAWVRELRDHGRFAGIPDSEAYHRLAHILGHSLAAYIPGGKDAEREMKRLWMDTYRVEDPGSLDTDTLMAYLPLAGDGERGAVLRELATRPGLHPLHRAAVLMELGNRRLLLGA